jgi:exonuclease VII small subunit
MENMEKERRRLEVAYFILPQFVEHPQHTLFKARQKVQGIWRQEAAFCPILH